METASATAVAEPTVDRESAINTIVAIAAIALAQVSADGERDMVITACVNSALVALGATQDELTKAWSVALDASER